MKTLARFLGSPDMPRPRFRRPRLNEVIHRPPCPKCGLPMALRMGRGGPFFQCGCRR